MSSRTLTEAVYLAQSYQDAWADYDRSLSLPGFPVWDYVVLTASDEHQAEGFRLQLKARRGFLPAKTVFAVVPDEGNVRVGSGGATLSVLRYIREREESFSGLRILVIHSGGDSRRIPQYSALGKLFSPVPHALPDGRASTLFDECLISMASVPGRLREGVVLVSGDVLLLFNPLLIDFNGHGAACISFKENARKGTSHGVFLRGEDGNVRAFLHKQSLECLEETGAVNEAGQVDIDTGAVIFGRDLTEALYGLVCTDGQPDEEKYRALVNPEVRLSLYGDFLYPLASDSLKTQFLRENPEGAFTPQLLKARERLWEVLSPFSMKLMRLAPARFLHFGTVPEVRTLFDAAADRYRELGWSRSVHCAPENGIAGVYSVIAPDAQVGEHCFFEYSCVREGAKVGEGSVLSWVEVSGEVPPGVVLHGLKLWDGRFVCRIFGVEDNPKEPCLFGKPLTGELWEKGEARILWNARLYPACSTMEEAVEEALKLYREGPSGRGGESLASGFQNADPRALLDWSRHMRDLVQMNGLLENILRRRPVTEQQKLTRLSSGQEAWVKAQLSGMDYSMRMRLHYYLGEALEDPGEVAKAFRVLREEILREASEPRELASSAHITDEELTVSLPLRVNWGGGWTDTPPYCNERGGSVLNASILLNGERPVRVHLRRIQGMRIVLKSTDMGTCGVFTELSELQAVGDPFDPFVLQKSALLACGILPFRGGNLQEILTGLGGGFELDTEVADVPQGSGLGTSSILAAACVKGIFQFFGIPCASEKVYGYVLRMEQLMSTGGGWQDQAGGLSEGIQFITSLPGIRQELRVRRLELQKATREELSRRFALIYTGQRRLARNLLRDVVGRYIGNVPETVQALDEIQRVAALMAFELERGGVDAFAKLLNRHWELSRQIDEESTNTLIDQIFLAIDDLIDGRMICGAGGGGFLQVVMKRQVTRESLQARLESVFGDSAIGVWDCTLL